MSEKASKDLYESDSDFDPNEINTIGNIPIEWYEQAEFDHIGYDLTGKKIIRKHSTALEDFLKREDPNYNKMVYDPYNDRTHVLTKEERTKINRMLKGKYLSSTATDEFPSSIDMGDPRDVLQRQMPLVGAPLRKAQFTPSKNQAKQVMKLVRALRKGYLLPMAERKRQAEEDPLMARYDVWDADMGEGHGRTIPPPPQDLPRSDESFNPPEEYLPTAEERAEWEEEDPSTRGVLPQRFGLMRAIPAYLRATQEQFQRCKDLYLATRVTRQRTVTNDPTSILPALPSTADLRPFPSKLVATFDVPVTKFADLQVSRCGRYVACCGGHAVAVVDSEFGFPVALTLPELEHRARSVAWMGRRSVLAVASGSDVLFAQPSFGDETLPEAKTHVTGAASETAISHVSFSRTGQYMATTLPITASSGARFHHMVSGGNLTLRVRKSGKLVASFFHPRRPGVIIVNEHSIDIKPISQGEGVKPGQTLEVGGAQLTCAAVHPSGLHIVAGTASGSVLWFDTELDVKAVHTLKLGKRDKDAVYTITSIAVHPRLPLFAVTGDNIGCRIFHARVDPIEKVRIVPVARLKLGEQPQRVAWHPRQPWAYVSTAKGVHLFM
ncbi:BOP1NT (NUC169) domain [Carpediemonas membranifera]|uniref:BOP1NT (NUC169) domain n=1 Tax=Carpediemonas membranifera TaxID=201153 RepID=A0A8J6BBY9_9EUKA|nr:BOP1NT (NUC169) domain [Carpediemonas membranifera]|eukprot:KAG9397067.1 BOP1NT (NUC169) domain [Carpediemonas membranifera]